MITMRHNHRMISTDAELGTRRCILVVAQQIEVRAKIARVLQTAGYVVELAESQKRALDLAAGGQIEAAIVVTSSELAGLGEELRTKIPRTIVVGPRTNEMIRQDCSLPGTHALSTQALDEQKLLDQLGRPTVSPGSADSAIAAAPVLQVKDCKIDLSGHSFVDGNGREAHLTRAETALLAAFVGNPCRVLSRDQLRRAVAGHGAQPYDRNIDMLISRLRRKIESEPKSARFILTVPGLGYKFAARPQSVDDSESLPAITATSAPDQARSPNSEPGRGQLSVEDLQRELAAVKAELAELQARVDLPAELKPDLSGTVRSNDRNFCERLAVA